MLRSTFEPDWVCDSRAAVSVYLGSGHHLPSSPLKPTQLSASKMQSPSSSPPSEDQVHELRSMLAEIQEFDGAFDPPELSSSTYSSAFRPTEPLRNNEIQLDPGPSELPNPAQNLPQNLDTVNWAEWITDNSLPEPADTAFAQMPSSQTVPDLFQELFMLEYQYPESFDEGSTMWQRSIRDDICGAPSCALNKRTIPSGKSRQVPLQTWLPTLHKGCYNIEYYKPSHLLQDFGQFIRMKCFDMGQIPTNESLWNDWRETRKRSEYPSLGSRIPKSFAYLCTLRQESFARFNHHVDQTQRHLSLKKKMMTDLYESTEIGSRKTAPTCHSCGKQTDVIFYVSQESHSSARYRHLHCPGTDRHQ